MHQRLIQVLLSAMLAFWSPIWCCCAKANAHADHPDSSPGLCSHCPLSSSTGDHAPLDSSDQKQPCPHHASLHTLAQVEKAPHIHEIPLSLSLAINDLDSWVLPAVSASSLSFASPVPLDTASRTLVATSCQLSI